MIRFEDNKRIDRNSRFVLRSLFLRFSVLIGMLLLGGCEKNTSSNVGDIKLIATKSTVAKDQLFIHPGIVNSKENLDLIASQMRLGDSNRIKGYDQIESYIQQNSMPATFPDTVIVDAVGTTPTEYQIRKDALLAYAYTLKWASTGNENDAHKAKFILNGWSGSFKAYGITEGTDPKQAWLEASWVLPTFVASAEILRHYKVKDSISSNWAADDINRFSVYMTKLKNTCINPLVTLARESNLYKTNVGVSAAYAKLTLGAYFSDDAIYSDGRKLLKELLNFVIKIDGSIVELCNRDCFHPQYSLSGFTLSAETMRLQGDSSLYISSGERIRLGWEMIATALAGNLDCRNCSDYFVYPSVEIASFFYKTPALVNLAGKNRPYGVTENKTFLGFTTYTHHLLSF